MNIDDRYLVELLIKNQNVFSVCGHDNDEIGLYDQYNNEFKIIGEQSHFIRHAVRVIESAKYRFNKTIDTDGKRIPGIDLPIKLAHFVHIDSVEESQIIALNEFCSDYDENISWPDCTMPVIKTNE
jgi:hypothetical protein